MEKIFDIDFRKSLINSLKSAGIEENKAYNIVDKQYKEKLREVVSEKFKQWSEEIRLGRDISIPIEESPSGDGYGKDNRFIWFKDICGLEDIGDVIDVLEDY